MCFICQVAICPSPLVDEGNGFLRKSVQKAKLKRAQSFSQYRSPGKTIALSPLSLPKAKGKTRALFQHQA
uniref:Uncharacterized protein n=1 Tax=Callorhinchus milii TaxID=7868 RepID=A0A4W3KEX5_CALMI